MAKARRLEKDVTLDTPCDKCGATSKFAKFTNDERTWYVCSRSKKVGDEWEYCNGKPSVQDPEPSRSYDEPQAIAAPPYEEAVPAQTGQQGKAPTRRVAQLFDTIADHYAVLSTLFAELRDEIEK